MEVWRHVHRRHAQRSGTRRIIWTASTLITAAEILVERIIVALITTRLKLLMPSGLSALRLVLSLCERSLTFLSLFGVCLDNHGFLCPSTLGRELHGHGTLGFLGSEPLSWKEQHLTLHHKSRSVTLLGGRRQDVHACESMYPSLHVYTMKVKTVCARILHIHQIEPWLRSC